MIRVCPQVAVVKCSAGIDYIPADLITLDPQQTTNISFTMHSIYSVGKINKCDGRHTIQYLPTVCMLVCVQLNSSTRMENCRTI